MDTASTSKYKFPHPSPPQPPTSDQDLKVYEIGTKEIRYLAMAFIAVTTGFIAGQGFLAATILTAVVILGGLILEDQAKTKFLDLNSALPTAAHVELFIHSHFWKQTLLVGTLIGLTGALAVCGAIAFINEAFFEGLALHLLAWLGFVPFAQSELGTAANLGNDAHLLYNKLMALRTSLVQANQNGTLPSSLPSFLLKQVLSNIQMEDFFQEIKTHAKDNNISIKIYFKCLRPLLTSDMIYRFTVDYPEEINQEFLLDNLSQEQFDT